MEDQDNACISWRLYLSNIIKDKNIDADSASDIFFSSKTFADITNKKYNHYKKNWQEIYKMLQKDLDT